MLCKACQDVFAGTSARTISPLNIRTHHPSLRSFQTSIAAGCHLCLLISTCDAFLPDPSAEDFEDRHKHSRIEWLFLDDELLFIERKYSECGTPSTILPPEAILKLIEAEKAEDAASLYVESPSTLSDSSLAIAQEWYNHCLGEHCSACAEAASTTEPFFPSRIVDVGAPEDAAIRLFVPEPGFEKRYATLSHSWGHSQSLRLIQNNLEILQNGIDIETLPRTFQHAVYVARKLGLRYLWIDSLCILQDSADDWRKESATMRHIYSNGSLNIAATAASGDQDGLSFQRNPRCSRHITVNVTWQHPDLVSHKPPGRYYIFNGDIWDREVESAPLNKRGWVLQERSLSPRILHFGRSQLYWQCNTALRSEMFPRDLRTKNLGPHAPRVTSRFTARLRALRQRRDGHAAPGEHGLAAAAAAAYARWSELVNAYSATRLSRPADKLIAVQALADAMQDATGDAYVAGLWRSRLAEDVLWRTDVDGRRAVRRPELWRAPTWSWASLDAHVESRGAYHYVGGRGERAAPFFVAEMVPRVEGFGGVETGQLRSARLGVKGLLYRSGGPIAMRVMDEPLSLYRLARADAPWSLKVFLDEWDGGVVHAAEYTIPAGSLFFPVGSPIAGTVEGLVLGQVAGIEGEFQRIALFEVDVLEPGDASNPLEGLQILEGAEHLGHLKHGEDSEGRTVYEFTLV